MATDRTPRPEASSPLAPSLDVPSDSWNPTDDVLTCTSDHPVSSTNPPLLDFAKAQRMAEFFSFLGDPNRLRILSVLAAQELCVGDLAAVLALSESATSHQLRALKALRLVSYRRVGRHVFYRLQDDHVLSLYQVVAEHLDEVS